MIACSTCRYGLMHRLEWLLRIKKSFFFPSNIRFYLFWILCNIVSEIAVWSLLWKKTIVYCFSIMLVECVGCEVEFGAWQNELAICSFNLKNAFWVLLGLGDDLLALVWSIPFRIMHFLDFIMKSQWSQMKDFAVAWVNGYSKIT